MSARTFPSRLYANSAKFLSRAYDLQLGWDAWQSRLISGPIPDLPQRDARTRPRRPAPHGKGGALPRRAWSRLWRHRNEPAIYNAGVRRAPAPGIADGRDARGPFPDILVPRPRRQC